jgi:hypothetical protein
LLLVFILEPVDLKLKSKKTTYTRSTQPGIVVHNCNFSTREAEATGLEVQLQPWAMKQDLVSKKKKEKEKKHQRHFHFLAGINISKCLLIIY